MKKAFIFFLLSVFSLLALGQESNPIVPPGYNIKKIADINKIVWGRLAFDSQGNLYIATESIINKIDTRGEISVYSKPWEFKVNFIFNIQCAPDGSLIAYCRVGEEGTYPYQFAVYKITPDALIGPLITQTGSTGSIAFDRQGNFYMVSLNLSSWKYQITRYDKNYHEVEIVSPDIRFASDSRLCFDSANNLYWLWPVLSPQCKIWKIPAGPDGIPGPDDQPVALSSNLGEAGCLVADENGNLIVTERQYWEFDGYSSFLKQRILQVNPTTGDVRVIAENIDDFIEPDGVAYRNGVIYLCHLNQTIGKLDLQGNYSLCTRDYGCGSPTAFVRDSIGRLFTYDSMTQHIHRLNEDGTFSRIEPGMGQGIGQTLISDGRYFYLQNIDRVTNSRNITLRFDPFTSTTEILVSTALTHRTAAFDSYGRLISQNRNSRQLEIFDLTTGTITPYVVGFSSILRCFQFDTRQNLYFNDFSKGIKKVHLEKDPVSPINVSGEPYFYDFSSMPTPWYLGYSAVSPDENVFIPHREDGIILQGDPSGRWVPFASGFVSPTYANFDDLGRLYIIDQTNAIYQITNSSWTLPIAKSKIDSLVVDIRQSAIESGMQKSLTAKLEAAKKQVERNDLAPAINQVEAFRNEVAAQKGKKIPLDLAEKWDREALTILAALRNI
jgi:hypothetical protein